jgi:5-methylcytosine-specific restriction endonuclease McrA
MAVPPASTSIRPAKSGAESAPYRRSDWRHWIDADHDCQDTRQEVLIAESEVPVEFADARHCRVRRGRWTCPYTGRVVTDPAELDIDHVVPLENANASGGWRWSPERRREYANDLRDPEHLVAVLASANRQKGSKGPDAWLPSNEHYRCAYVTDWIAIQKRWATDLHRD